MTVDYLSNFYISLQEGGVEYLVVGGLAVNAHGYQRFTRDVDLVISLEPTNLDRALTVLDKMGFRPVAPVELRDFGNASLRKEWVEQRNMTVFSVVSDQMVGLTVDIFAEHPFDFGSAYEDAFCDVFREGLEIKVVDLDRLIAMKKSAGREQDLIDVEYLTQLRNEND